MGSKTKITTLLIPGLLAMLLFISSQGTARTFQQGGEVVQEANDDAGDPKFLGGGVGGVGGGVGGFYPGSGFTGSGFYPGTGGFSGGGFRRTFDPRFCRFGCCSWNLYFRGCFRCCPIY